MLFKYNIIALAFVFLLSACGSANFRGGLREQVAAGNIETAIELINFKETNDSFDQGLAMLERGLAKHLLGDFAASNEELEKVKTWIAEKQAASISQETAKTFLTGDIGDYQFYPYEILLVRYYKVMNYMALGDISTANIEVRQIDNLLKTYNLKELSNKSSSFFYIISAIVHAASRNWQDAVASVRIAQKLTGNKKGVIPSKVEAILKCSNVGNNRECPEFFDKGQVAFVIFEVGFVKLLEEEKTDILDNNSPLTIALPYYPKTKAVASKGKILDVNEMAQEALTARLPALTAQAATRAATRGAAIVGAAAVGANAEGENKEVIQAASALTGLLVGLVSKEIEAADLRSWTLLPARASLFSKAITNNNIDGVVTSDRCRKNFSKEKNQNTSKVYLLSARCL